MIGIGVSLLYKQIGEGKIRGIKVGTRTVIPHEEIERWMRNELAAQPFADGSVTIRERDE